MMPTSTAQIPADLVGLKAPDVRQLKHAEQAVLCTRLGGACYAAPLLCVGRRAGSAARRDTLLKEQ